MMELKLQVIDALPQALFSLSAQDFPAGVTGTLTEYAGGELSLPEDAVSLLLTDDAERVRALSQDKPDRLRIVFVGEPDGAAGLEDVLEDVWRPDEGTALKRRFLRLVGALKNEYDLRFCRSVLLATIDNVPDMLWYKRADGAHVLVNDAFAAAVRKSKDNICGKDHFDVWDAPRPAEGSAAFSCAESEEAAISSGKRHACSESVKTGEGMRQFATCKTPIYDPFGVLFGTVGVSRDVTSLDNFGAQLSLLIENLPFPVCVFDAGWKAVRMNSSFALLVGLSPDDVPTDFDYRAWKSDFFRLPPGEGAEGGAYQFGSREYQRSRNGRTRQFLVTELEIRNNFGDVSGYFSIMEDITYRRAYEQSMRRAANTDMLTGLYNRRYFNEFTRSSTGKPFHLMYMDLDHFKEINDVHGHSTGDEVLIKVTGLLHEFFPRMLISRLGGDEFVVMDGEHDRDYIDRQCAAFEAAVADALREYGQNSSVSIGIARTDGSAEDIDRVLKESDQRMYEIKQRHHKGR